MSLVYGDKEDISLLKCGSRFEDPAWLIRCVITLSRSTRDDQDVAQRLKNIEISEGAALNDFFISLPGYFTYDTSHFRNVADALVMTLAVGGLPVEESDKDEAWMHSHVMGSFSAESWRSHSKSIKQPRMQTH